MNPYALTPASDPATVVREYRLAVEKAKRSGFPLRRSMDSFLRFLRSEGIEIPELIQPQYSVISLQNHLVKEWGDVSAKHHCFLQLEAALEDQRIQILYMLHGAYGAGKSTLATAKAGPDAVVYDAPNLAKEDRDRVLRLARTYRVQCHAVSVRATVAELLARNADRTPAERVPEDQIIRSFDRASRGIGRREGFDSVTIV